MALKRTGPPKRRQRLKPRGKRAERVSPARDAFKLAVRERAMRAGDPARGLYLCERCTLLVEVIDPHHLCPVKRGEGLPLLDDPEANGAALCRYTRNDCHNTIHFAKTCPDRGDWLKTRRWLAEGGRRADPESMEEGR